jgi:hypothetical protein
MNYSLENEHKSLLYITHCYRLQDDVTLSTDSLTDPAINDDDDADDDSVDVNVGGVGVVIVTSQSQSRTALMSPEEEAKPESAGQGHPPFVDDDQTDAQSLPDNNNDVIIDHHDVRPSSINERLFSPVMATTKVG